MEQEGFEPSLSGCKPEVLPLNDCPIKTKKPTNLGRLPALRTKTEISTSYMAGLHGFAAGLAAFRIIIFKTYQK